MTEKTKNVKIKLAHEIIMTVAPALGFFLLLDTIFDIIEGEPFIRTIGGFFCFAVACITLVSFKLNKTTFSFYLLITFCFIIIVIDMFFNGGVFAPSYSTGLMALLGVGLWFFEPKIATLLWLITILLGAIFMLLGQNGFLKAADQYTPFSYFITMVSLQGVMFFAIVSSTKMLHRFIKENEIQKTILIEKEKELQTLISNIPGAVYRCASNNNYSIEYISQEILSITGYEPEEFINKTKSFHSLVCSEDKAQLYQVLKSAVQQKTTFSIEYKIKSKSNEDIWVLEKGQLIQSDDELKLEGVLLNITDRHKMKEELNQTRKMDAIGQLAGGIAHDFNNILSSILGSSELLKLKHPENDNERIFIDLISMSSKRAAELTSKLLSFSRKEKTNLIPLCLKEIIEESIDILERSLNKNIKIISIVDDDSLIIMGDRPQVQNIILNLAINASHAMENGGTLTIQAKYISLDDIFCKNNSFQLKPGAFVELIVQDTGVGIKEEHLDKIFEPYFTTKPEGQGTGLGLSSIYGIIKDYHGDISVESNQTFGTKFTLHFPSTQEKDLEHQEELEVLKGHGNILLIEDDKNIIISTTAMIESLGYQCISFINGNEAINYFNKNHNNIRAIILDMIMPDINGKDVFEELRKIDPASKIIISTGYSKEKDIEDMIKKGANQILNKPYLLSDLSQKVAQ